MDHFAPVSPIFLEDTPVLALKISKKRGGDVFRAAMLRLNYKLPSGLFGNTRDASAMHEQAKFVCFNYMQPQKVKIKFVQINMKHVSYIHMTMMKNWVRHILFLRNRGLIVYLAALKKGLFGPHIRTMLYSSDPGDPKMRKGLLFA